ncbi:MAG: alpha/beta fold hydrolase [Chloroflexota bacterium]
MATIHRKTIKLEGRDVSYYTAGHGEPVLVLHGGGGDARTWLQNIAALAEKYTVYAPDLPGYGGSQPLDGSYFIPELAEFVESFARSLGLEKFHLMGNSLGGGVALNYALKSPHRVRKLVLVSSLCLGKEIALWVRLLCIPTIFRAMVGMTMAVLRGVRWVVEQLNPAGYIMPLSPAAMTLGGSITTFKAQTLVLDGRLPEVAVPTLLVWGARDQIVPVHQAYRAAKAIPDCQLKVFENRGHNVHRDEVKQFSSIITRFLG